MRTLALTFLIAFAVTFFFACASARVLVRDCQTLQGSDGQQNCELIQKL